MRRESLVAVLLGCLLLSCSGKKPPGQSAPTDSTHAADSTTASTPPRLLSYEERQGEVLYTKYCAVCHGQEGKGDGFNAYNLDPHPRDFSDSAYMKALGDEQIVETIAGGGRSANKSPLMPGYGHTLTRQQIRYVEAFVRTFSRP